MLRNVELWTADEAARHWEVTPARARGILSGRGINRVSGYPADEVRAVRRRQGARTDLAPAPRAMKIGDVAAAIGRADDDRIRMPLFFEFVRGADESGPAALSLITEEPPTTGSWRYDSLLAAIAEHLAARHGRPGPLWSITAERFLSAAWWISPLPSARSGTMVWTPASFRRRGIYLDRADLAQDGAPPMAVPLLDRTELRRAFTALAEKLQRRRTIGHVHVVDGAAMLLAYDPHRAATQSIDAAFSPDGPMVSAVREVASEFGWPPTWLNNQAASYTARTPGYGSIVFDHPYLQVAASPPEHLLAMKVLAARPVRDADDINFLIDYLSIRAEADVWAAVHRYFPTTEIRSHSRELINDLL